MALRANPSTKAIPSSVSQVGIDITLTGGESNVFDGVRGFFVINTDDSQYVVDFPIELTKSPDGVIGAKISSVDASLFNGVEGTAISTGQLTHYCAYTSCLSTSSSPRVLKGPKPREI